MHFLGPDLYLERLPHRTHQRRVERLIHIWLRHGNIILKTSRNRRIHLMDHTQSRIAVLHGIHNDPHCKQIINLIHGLILIDHFLINTEEVLNSSVDLCLNVGIFHMVRHFVHNLLNKFFSFRLSCIDLLYKIKENLRLRILKRQVVKLCLNLGNTKPLGNRSVDVHGLLCLFLLLGRRHKLQCPHIMQTVGKLNDNNPDILRHCKKHFS